MLWAGGLQVVGVVVLVCIEARRERSKECIVPSTRYILQYADRMRLCKTRLHVPSWLPCARRRRLIELGPRGKSLYMLHVLGFGEWATDNFLKVPPSHPTFSKVHRLEPRAARLIHFGHPKMRALLVFIALFAPRDGK